MMHIVKTRLKRFSAAHRVLNGYTGKCNNLHGHDYGIVVAFGAEKLNQYGFVLDFTDIKKYCNEWVQTQWDHGVIVHENDQPLIKFLQAEHQKHFILTNKPNTTAECLAECLFEQLLPITNTYLNPTNSHVQLLNVEVWENEDSCASYGTQGSVTTGAICGTP